MMERLLQEASSVVAGNPDVWEAQAVMKAALGELDEALDLRAKQVRQMMAALQWQHSGEDFSKLVAAEEGSVELQVQLGSKKALYSSRLHIRGLLRKAQEAMSSTEAYGRLEELLTKVSAAEKAATAP